VLDLLLHAKELSVAARGDCPWRGGKMSNDTCSGLTSGEDLASVPTAQGGLSRLAVARAQKRGRGDITPRTGAIATWLRRTNAWREVTSPARGRKLQRSGGRAAFGLFNGDFYA
jgi:hypothetical protein